MTSIGSSFDHFLEEQGLQEETVAVASKRVLAWQLARAMEEGHLSKEEMANRMGTTTSQIDRVLDPTTLPFNSTHYIAPPRRLDAKFASN